MKCMLPYGRGHIEATIDDGRPVTVLSSRLESYRPGRSGEELVREAMRRPAGGIPLRRMAEGREQVVLIASDHTRPVPSRLLIPPMLEEIRRGNPRAQVTILIATGCHRASTPEELREKLGPEIVGRERIVVHDCTSREDMAEIGILPSGGALRIHRLAAGADLLVSEGFIEPHFFAGFSGGRKSVLPGVAARESVLWNHCADFIRSPHAAAGVLDGNPIHADMAWAARAAGLRYILNVVINGAQEVLGAFAGQPDRAHRAGAEFLAGLCGVRAEPADIVLVSNNGHPMDQNIYQAVKGMSTAARCCKPGGVIVMAAACEDGHGGEAFADAFRAGRTPGEILDAIEQVPAGRTEPDQWQSQILARVMASHRVILVSRADPALVRGMQMQPAATVAEALAAADRMLGRRGDVLVIPEGVSTMVL